MGHSTDERQDAARHARGSGSRRLGEAGALGFLEA